MAQDEYILLDPFVGFIDELTAPDTRLSIVIEVDLDAIWVLPVEVMSHTCIDNRHFHAIEVCIIDEILLIY